MNVKLLRKVKRHILAEPKCLLMFGWARFKEQGHKLFTDDGDTRPFGKCGTAGCIAGWACILEGEKALIPSEYERKARLLLSLNKLEAERLFYPMHWPQKFSGGSKDDGKSKTAKVAAARIEHFIRTKGKE